MPEPLWLILTFVLGFALALLPTLLLIRSRVETAREAARRETEPELAALVTVQRETETELAALKERLAGREATLQQRELELRQQAEKLERLSQQATVLASDKAKLETQLDAETRRSEEKLQTLNQARAEMQAQFTNLANQIFEEKTKSFSEQSRSNLDTILKPFKEKIGDFERKVTEVYTTEGKERHSLMREVQRLQELNRKLGDDAENLTKALKGDSRTQGAWGEIILEQILEESGLRKGKEYDAQGGFRDAEGKLLKPDVVVHLPDRKEIVIDSKVSLIAYERYFKAEQEEDRAQ
ncbi:MAG: DNA recombination protein RmuC, partial [Desulfuromonadales bacterium]|nr:DNA recombination protein RmuC [Desulfuromonadales bacterium]